MIEAYLIHLLILIGIYSILAVSLNLAIGYTGLLNLGHIAFFGVGAYFSALLTINGLPFLLAFIIAGIASTISGVILILATRKLKGDYLALASLGFAFVVYSLFLNLKITRGPLGIPGIPKPEIVGILINTNLEYLIFVLIIAVISIFFIYLVVNSPFGRLLKATRDDELKLKTLGKDTFKLKYKAMAISAFFAGIAGSLFAHYITYIDPSSFYLADLILIITIVIIGGLASIPGSIFGTILVLLVPEFLRFVNLPSSLIGPGRQIIYAVILLAILLYKPRGLMGEVDLE